MRFQKIILTTVVCTLFSACFRPVDQPKTASSARVNIPSWGIVIDAHYDSTLDGLVKGYKMITVALTNRSVDLIRLDQLKDEWIIEDAWGRKVKAINSLRIHDPATWANLPDKVQDLLEYPAGVQMSFTQTFDIFFPASYDLNRFRSISFHSAQFKQTFEAIAPKALERAVPSGDLGDDGSITVPMRTPKVNKR